MDTLGNRSQQLLQGVLKPLEGPQLLGPNKVEVEQLGQPSLIARWAVAGVVSYQPSFAVRFGIAPRELDIRRNSNPAIAQAAACKRFDAGNEPGLVLGTGKHDREGKHLACATRRGGGRHRDSGGSSAEPRCGAGREHGSIAIINCENPSNIAPSRGKFDPPNPSRVIWLLCALVPLDKTGGPFPDDVSVEIEQP